MPPKKKSKPSVPKGPGSPSAPSTRESRAAARQGRESLDSTTSVGKRKRDVLVEEPEVELKPRGSGRNVKGKMTKKVVKFSGRECQSWFETYADPEAGEINGETLGTWMEDLGASAEGVVMYFLLYKCAASSTMTITNAEFVKTMTEWSVDSNEKLLAKLTKDDFIYKLRPRPSKETDSPEFLPFYKWCFNHFRVEQAKNVTADVAMVLMETLLDPAKYKPGYRPEEEHGDEEAGAPRLNHLKVFLEFLRSGPKPPVIITRDQYEQFYFFNKQVPWDLEGYDEATSTWPTLMDDYIVWKKEHYPTTSAN